MYSPKIREDLIPKLYQIKQAQDGKPMTQIIDELLRPEVVKLYQELIAEEQACYDYNKPERR